MHGLTPTPSSGLSHAAPTSARSVSCWWLTAESLPRHCWKEPPCSRMCPHPGGNTHSKWLVHSMIQRLDPSCLNSGSLGKATPSSAAPGGVLRPLLQLHHSLISPLPSPAAFTPQQITCSKHAVYCGNLQSLINLSCYRKIKSKRVSSLVDPELNNIVLRTSSNLLTLLFLKYWMYYLMGLSPPACVTGESIWRSGTTSVQQLMIYWISLFINFSKPQVPCLKWG